MVAAAFGSIYLISIVIGVSFNLLALAQDADGFVYNGFSEDDLELTGSSYIHPSGLLQVANGFSVSAGYAFYRNPIKFNPSSSQSLSFSTNFVFAMVPGSLYDQNFSGNGMAFVISPSSFSQALAGTYLRILNRENDVAVELVTIQPTRFEVIDGENVEITVNSRERLGYAKAAYVSDEEGTYKSVYLASGNPIHIWIDYHAAEKLLNVALAPIKIPKPERPLLSIHIDHSQFLLDSMHVGFSASTGFGAPNNYVLGWSFSKGSKAQDVDISQLPSIFPFSPPPGKASQKPGLISIALLISATVMLIAIVGAVYLVRKKKYEELYEDWEKEYGPQRFSYKNLYKATKGFKDKELIGKGGFGKVYRGVLPSSNEQIAVKKVCHDSKQGMKEFVAEIASLGRLRHRNLVQLRGYCRRRGEFLLVYDHMPNGSLDKFLHSNIKPNLNWFQRFRIIRGIASSLLYLHEGWEQVVLHRDIKPGNVLLDADLNGKLGDFGLARLHDHGSVPQTTNLVGTFGYLAPELTRTGKTTTSTDVYAFGVFMLEVACGRRPIEQEELPETANLVYWVTDCWKRGSILDASDPRLEDVYAEDQMKLVLKLGLFCSHRNASARPSMRQVMQYLDGDVMLPDTPSDSTVIGLLMANDEASESEMSFPSLLGNSSVLTSDSILTVGR